MNAEAANHEYVKELYHRLDRRWNAPSPVLQYAHRKKFEKILAMIKPGETVLDIGRGGSVDGVLGVLAAASGAQVTIANVEEANLKSIMRFAALYNVHEKISFVISNPQTGDAFADNSFDTVVSLHVLEHLSDFDAGIQTIRRITRSRAIIALPTCLNFCVWIRFGMQNCYHLSLKSVLALFDGFGQVAKAFMMNCEGVVEDQTEDSGQRWAHLWRFPWKMRQSFRKNGFKIVKFGPDTMCLPWFASTLLLSNFLDKIGYWPVIRNFGYGSHALLQKE